MSGVPTGVTEPVVAEIEALAYTMKGVGASLAQPVSTHERVTGSRKIEKKVDVGDERDHAEEVPVDVLALRAAASIPTSH